MSDAQNFWNNRYGEAGPIWSGSVNAALAEVMDSLSSVTPGRSLDLGSGEGGDVLWLARRGWDAHGLEFSDVAVERARTNARERGLNARFDVVDLETWEPATWSPGFTCDLLTACFFQSEVELNRDAVIRKALGTVARGGRALLISHAAPPSWVHSVHKGGHGPTHFVRPEDELKNFGTEWEIERAEIVRREAKHHGNLALMDDTIVLARHL